MASENQPPSDRLDRIEADLERLKERHEALAQSMELNYRDQQQDAANIRQLAEIARDALASIRGLERIATAHQQRIDDQEKRLDDLES
jgi:hypothetical protein